TAAARDRLRERIPTDVPVYVSTTPLISRLVGFQFHRGTLACGLRPPARSLESLWRDVLPGGRALIVLCPEIRDPENLGTIIRTAAAFGALGVVAGREGTDPFSRRVLRTSMGAVLRLPIAQTEEWDGTIESLKDAGFETIATVVDPEAEALWGAARPER